MDSSLSPLPLSPIRSTLAIDIGNTHITVGLFKDTSLSKTWRLHTYRHGTSDELGIQLQRLLQGVPLPHLSPHSLLTDRQGSCSESEDLEGICVASVVPSLDEPMVQACQKYLGCTPLVVDSKVDIGIRNLYKRPEEVGADRLVNAVAVHALYRKAAVVVDFGTATTFDCITARGDYLGGAICPGLELAGEWLSTHTAKLPRVTFQESPTRAIGKTTKESLQSGLFWGYIALVDGLLQRLTAEMKGHPVVVITGGLSTVIGPHLKTRSRIDPDLTLEGLRLIWERNRRKGGSR